MSDATQTDDSVIKILEDYLRHEGLYEVIAEHRRRHVFRWPSRLTSHFFWGFVWLFTFWLPEIGIVGMTKGIGSWQFALMVPPAVVIGYLMILGLVVAPLLFSNRLRAFSMGHSAPARSAPGSEDETLSHRINRFSVWIALGLFVGTPAVVSIILLLDLSWRQAVLYFISYAGIAGTLMLLINISDEVLYRLYVVQGFIAMVGQIVRQMLRHLPFIASILLVIVLFSIFSSEFWEALGNLRPANLVVCIALLIALPLVSALFSLRRETEETIKVDGGVNFLQTAVLNVAEQTKFIKDSLDQDHVKPTEWTAVKNELAWRVESKLCENIAPIIRKRVTRWLVVLLTATVMFLFVAFFIYFSLLFNFLIDPNLIARWLNPAGGAAPETIKLIVPVIQRPIEISATVIAILKVSLLLSAFIATMSTVYVLTDETIKARFTESLRTQARSWIALSCIYRNLISPGYQIWSYTIRKKNIASVSIVIPQRTEAAAIEAACTNVRMQFRKLPQLTLITAFEKVDGETAYSYGMDGRCWQMLFHANTVNGQLVQYQAPARPAVGQQPNDTWFGNTARAQLLSKPLSSSVQGLLHSYIFDGGEFANYVVRLQSRLSTRTDYLNLMRSLTSGVNTPELVNLTISIYVYNGATQEELAFLLYNPNLRVIAYRDCIDDRIHFLNRRKVLPL